MHTIELETLSGQEVEVPIEDRLYAGGDLINTEETFKAVHPPTGAHLADIPIATADHVEKAVKTAQRASEQWRNIPVMDRRAAVEELADCIEDNAETLTTIDVADNGSCISRMQHDIGMAAETMRYFAGIATELKGETIPTPGATIDFTRREPYGVVGAVIPFNHPGMFVLHKLAPAVVAGNGIVIKPSEFTSLSALYIGQLINELDVFPDGLVNIVTGAGDVGAELVGHKNVGLVTMVGSVATGKKVMKGAADHLAPVILELGGKNPVIVFPDADIEDAAEGAVDAMALQWQGQSCGSGTRLLVHEDVADEIIERVVKGFEEVARNTGDPFNEDTLMGSIVSEPQFEKVTSYLEIAEKEGADRLTGGSVLEDLPGHFVEPTVYEVNPDMTIANEEIFGPVLSVIRWNDYNEVMTIANGVDYGLTGSIWTQDLEQAHRAAEDLEVGYVWVNQHNPHYTGAPFGGYKQSGIGRNESIDELLDHTLVKNVNIDLNR